MMIPSDSSPMLAVLVIANGGLCSGHDSNIGFGDAPSRFAASNVMSVADLLHPAPSTS